MHYALEMCEGFIPNHFSNEHMLENKLDGCLKAKFEIVVSNHSLVCKIVLNKNDRYEHIVILMSIVITLCLPLRSSGRRQSLFPLSENTYF